LSIHPNREDPKSPVLLNSLSVQPIHLPLGVPRHNGLSSVPGLRGK
jgi:hypothetical protein